MIDFATYATMYAIVCAIAPAKMPTREIEANVIAAVRISVIHSIASNKPGRPARTEMKYDNMPSAL